MKKADIGLIGLAVMGENLVMNMESKGSTVSVFRRSNPCSSKAEQSKFTRLYVRHSTPISTETRWLFTFRFLLRLRRKREY